MTDWEAQEGYILQRDDGTYVSGDAQELFNPDLKAACLFDWQTALEVSHHRKEHLDIVPATRYTRRTIMHHTVLGHET